MRSMDQKINTRQNNLEMASSTPLAYYLIYCPTVVVASCYKTVKGLRHHDHDANHLLKHQELNVEKSEKGKKVVR